MTDTSAADGDDEQMRRVLHAYAKRELRKRMQSIRNVMPESAHAQRSERACSQLLALPQFSAATTIAGYVSMRKELSPWPALERAQAAGKRVVLPRVDGEELTFHIHRPGDPLEESGWGIPEPRPDAERVALDAIEVVLVPALALDLRGHRLGYGKGFYDRALPLLKNACAVGLCYDFQLLAEVPNETHDVPLAVVITDARTHVVNASDADEDTP